MIINCPDCATRYLIDPAVLAPDGRIVRCAKCGHSWREEPPSDLPRKIDLDSPARSRPTGPTAALPMPEQRRSSIGGWLVLALLVGGLLAGTWFGRERIVAAWPAAAQLYAAAGVPVQLPERFGLALRNLQSSTTVEAGVPVLVVAGDIINITDQIRMVPKLRVALRNSQRQEIYNWTFNADNAQLGPEGRLTFTTRLSGPPPEARDLQVSFVGEPRS